MFTSSTSRTRCLIAMLVAAASLGGVACTPSAPAPAPDPFPEEAAYNACPGSPCITLADIDTTGRTVKFRGETRYVSQPSQWFLYVHRGNDLVATFESGYLMSNRYDADLGTLPAGGAYRLTVLAGTPQGDQQLYKTFQVGPDVTATPTATNVKLDFTMPVPVTANAYIRRTDTGTLVATVNSTGVSTTHSLSSGATLDPTTGYTYQVDAKDAQGRIYRKQGSFTTRNVRLEVQLTGLQITDDSDFFGAGELRSQLHVGSTKTWIWQNEKSVETAGNTPYFPLTTSAALPSAVRSVPIHVVVSDDDCEGVGSLCNSGLGDLSVGSGSTSDLQWATATLTATLPNTTTTTTWTSFISSAKSPVGFIVTGSYRWVMV
jgi:hypothetical protein